MINLLYHYFVQIQPYNIIDRRSLYQYIRWPKYPQLCTPMKSLQNTFMKSTLEYKTVVYMDPNA